MTKRPVEVMMRDNGLQSGQISACASKKSAPVYCPTKKKWVSSAEQDTQKAFQAFFSKTKK